MTAQNRIDQIDPDTRVELPATVNLIGVRHAVGTDGSNTIALIDLARHIVDMHDARAYVEDDAHREHLAAVAANPAHVYVDSTKAPLPGKVEHGTNPTTDLLARVSAWEVGNANNPDSTEARSVAADLLRDSVQVIRTVAVDTLRVAAGDVFDTAMPAYVARWLEARASVLEVGGDVNDPDVMDFAVAEMTARARKAADQ